jgi:hypothetical protein
MKTLRVLLLLLSASLLSLSGGAVPCSAGQCGIVPIKPIPPIGCKDLTPVCVCDSNGTECHWEWVCVPE